MTDETGVDSPARQNEPVSPYLKSTLIAFAFLLLAADVLLRLHTATSPASLMLDAHTGVPCSPWASPSSAQTPLASLSMLPSNSATGTVSLSKSPTSSLTTSSTPTKSPATIVNATPSLADSARSVLRLRSPKPRCGPDTPGDWTAEKPYAWYVRDPSSCDYTVSSSWDFLAHFAGKKIVIAGDSTTRELAWDTIRVLLGCGVVKGIDGKYSHDISSGGMLGPQSFENRRDCELMRVTPEHGKQWYDTNVSIPVGSTGETVTIYYYWVMWPSQMLDQPWFTNTILSGDFDAFVFNFYLHSVRRPASTMNRSPQEWVLDELAGLMRALSSAPVGRIRDRIRDRFFWRSTFPAFRGDESMNNGDTVLTNGRAVDAMVAAAGFHVLNFQKYFTHAKDCPNGQCLLAADGVHAPLGVDLAIARELWSVVADTLAEYGDDEAGGR